MILFGQSVEEKYGDRIELLGIPFKDPLVLCQILIAIFFEEIIINGIFKQITQILYAGILSGGFAFVLQIYAQKNITPTPAAIIFSLEGVIATIAAWLLLSQMLNINNIIGCTLILGGVLLSQLAPIYKKNYK